MSTLSSVFIASSRTPPRPERRRDERKRLVYVAHQDDEGLGRCRNISSGGMQLELTMPGLAIGTRFKVAFSAAHVFDVTVIWNRDRQYGVALDEPIDFEAMLRESAAHTRARGFPRLRPGLRLGGGLLAMLHCDGRTRETRIRELAQQELKLTHDGYVRANLHLSVRLGAGREIHGVVRAVRGDLAEVVLTEPFSVGELGSVTMLAEGAERSWNRLYIDAR